MKLSDPKFAALAKRIDEERVMVVAIAALQKEKHSHEEIAAILDIDSMICGRIGTELIGFFEHEARSKPPKKVRDDICRMSKGWKLPPDSVAYARRYHFSDAEIREEAREFRDYWLTRSDKRNWEGTWQVRIRDQAKRLGKPEPMDCDAPLLDGPSQVLANAVSDETWRKAVARHRISGIWLRGFGPEPGQPGCRVPAHLLLAVAS
jgi:hypothetical protein